LFVVQSLRPRQATFEATCLTTDRLLRFRNHGSRRRYCLIRCFDGKINDQLCKLSRRGVVLAGSSSWSWVNIIAMKTIPSRGQDFW
jgi:hypothetical protein